MKGKLTTGKRRAGIAWLAAGMLVLGAPAQADETVHDPLEGFNRAMFAVNEGLDKVVIKPVAQAYDFVMPLPARAGVGDFFGNIADVRNALNNALQGKLGDAGSDLGRLLINSTIGIFGLFDVASELGLDKHDEDFGQTLGVWGWEDSSFVFWPVVGPRTVRDTGGLIVDVYTDPTWYTLNKSVAERNSLVALRYVDVRASLLPSDKVVEEAAIDKYAYVRDAYLQRRRNQIFDGSPPRLEDVLD
ncbi:VacJ family lipoprotein [Dechloromonas sp. H13]|uniref:MlaA family lipoprotein n=1 Tax=Dechloromonas sp. H13 TaxID=2570193 RepID=UPI00129222C9|nr:VacJ family lipoprotein [Dechloromonas sp. H13]